MNPANSPISEGCGTDTGTVTIAAPGQGRRIYLTDLAAKSNAACTLVVSSPAATAKFSVPLAADEGFEKVWSRGLVGGENEAVVITMSAGVYNINYSYVVG